MGYIRIFLHVAYIFAVILHHIHAIWIPLCVVTFHLVVQMLTHSLGLFVWLLLFVSEYDAVGFEHYCTLVTKAVLYLVFRERLYLGMMKGSV